MLALLLLLSTALALTVEEVPSPRPEGWVTDLAEVLDPAAEDRLDARIDALNTDVGVEIAVVTLADVPGTPKRFATSLFNHWGIGSAEANNGLLVLLVMGERRLEMETGLGMEEVLPSTWLLEMQQQRMVPRFKEGDFGGGLEAGLEAVDARIRTGPGEAGAPSGAPLYASDGLEGAAPSAPPPRATPDEGPLEALFRKWSLWLYGLFGGGAGVVLLGIRAWFRRWQRTCRTCKVRMDVLPEDEDDAHLDRGQRREEAIGSVDYDVCVCPSCDDLKVVRSGKWFSGYSKCKKCRYKTLSTSTTTIRAATYTSSGTARVTEDCAHCSFHRTYTKTIPRKQRSTSSSSGSSSSGFGGGSSRGGGAGSSW